MNVSGLALSFGQNFEGGVFYIDKPKGLTSFAIVRRIRRLLGIKKVGHAGTLDPFATGLLIVCVGRPATKMIDRFMTGKKTYLARVQLGVETETQDPEGVITCTADVPYLNREIIAQSLALHIGSQLQAPPPYSAAKYKGKPLYAYARQGVFIEKEARPIEIYSLECIDYDPLSSQLDIKVSCSRGTYIRVLAADIGRTFGCGAHLIELRRTASGPFCIEDSIAGNMLFEEEASHLLADGMQSIEKAISIIEKTAL